MVYDELRTAPKPRRRGPNTAPTKRRSIPAMNKQPGNKPGMPDWLLKQIETKQGGFRNARWRQCKNCGAITLYGMDDDQMAGMATVDTAPLTQQQEMWCALHGRDTYMLEISPERKIQINLRDSFSVARKNHRPIVAAHQCGHEYPGFIDALRKPKTNDTDPNAAPPF